MARFKIESDGDYYTIRDVPIFEEHDNRGFACDTNWMRDAIKNFEQQAAEDHRPIVMVGHNRGGVEEKEAIGFLDNLALKGKRLYADIVRVPKYIKEKIVQNAYPNRSVEVLPKSKRIVALALLGGTVPHFSLPQMYYDIQNSNELSLIYRSPEMDTFTNDQKIELTKIIGEAIGSALPEALTQYSHAGGEPAGAEQPQIYRLTDSEANQALQSGTLPELYEDTESAQIYSEDANGIHVWPEWIRQYLNSEESEGYQIDDETGLLYADGQVVGQVVPTAPDPDELLDPQPGEPNLGGAAAAVGAVNGAAAGGAREAAAAGAVAAGAGANPNLQPVARETSEQFSSLQSQVVDLTRANSLLQTGRRAEALEQYLLDQKQVGAPVGEISDLVEYLMTQTDEQIKQYKKVLEASPKVQLGEQPELVEGIQRYDAASVDRDWDKNRQNYSKFGVTKKDLEFAPFVRTNQGISN